MNTWSPLASAFNAKPNKLLSLHFTKGATVSRVVWGLILLFAVNFFGGTGLCYVVHGMGFIFGAGFGGQGCVMGLRVWGHKSMSVVPVGRLSDYYYYY